MQAFLDFLSAYAIWIYLAGVVGILFGFKLLVDSRRLARTTMFTLEQEQASDKALRALGVMLLSMFLIGAVSAVNTFVGPARPAPAATVSRPTSVAFTPPVILPTFTTVPTLTPPLPTNTPTLAPTRAAPATPSSRPTTEVTATVPVRSPTAVTALKYPKPQLNAPVPNDRIGRSFLQFLWGIDQLPTQLPPGESYRITLQYVDNATKQQQKPYACTQSNGIDTKSWFILNEIQGNAVDFKISWSVVVVRMSSETSADCTAGVPISPQSDVRSFYWP